MKIAQEMTVREHISFATCVGVITTENKNLAVTKHLHEAYNLSKLILFRACVRASKTFEWKSFFLIDVNNNNNSDDLYWGNFFTRRGFRKGPGWLRLKYIHKIKRKKGILIKIYVFCSISSLIIVSFALCFPRPDRYPDPVKLLWFLRFLRLEGMNLSANCVGSWTRLVISC